VGLQDCLARRGRDAERQSFTPEEWRVEMKLADSIADPDSPVHTFASFVVEDGRPGAERA
jgi:alkaline phosphatase D